MILEFGKSISKTLHGLFEKEVGDKTIERTIEEICISLIHANVNPKYIDTLRNEIRKKIAAQSQSMQSNTNKARMVQRAVFEALSDMLTPKTQPYALKRKQPNVIVFVGLQGAGKTTSICKYANYYSKNGYRTGIVCADTFRAGAFDQVKQNATKIGIPFYGSEDTDPVKVAKEGVSKFRKSDFELILVDTSGRHTQEEALLSEMRSMVGAIKPDNIVFVMDAGIGQSAEEQARGFKNAVAVGGIILTKLDGTSKAGGALSSVAVTNCPIEFIGIGEGMDDFERFDGRRFVSMMLGMGDLEGLAEKLSTIELNEEELTTKMMEGSFRLEDFKKLYKQLMSLGPLTKMLEMVPGMQNIPIPDERKFRRVMNVFDSISRSELRSNGDLFLKDSSRVRRVALGSGVGEDEVRETILNFKKMNGLMKSVMSNPMFSQMLGGGGGQGKERDKFPAGKFDDFSKFFNF